MYVFSISILAQGSQVFSTAGLASVITKTGLQLFNMNFAKVLLATLFGFIVMTLEGCGGCDEDKAKECIAAQLAKQTCATYSACFKDNECCDTEIEGTTGTVKDNTKAMCALLSTPADDKCA